MIPGRSHQLFNTWWTTADIWRTSRLVKVSTRNTSTYRSWRPFVWKVGIIRYQDLIFHEQLVIPYHVSRVRSPVVKLERSVVLPLVPDSNRRVYAHYSTCLLCIFLTPFHTPSCVAPCWVYQLNHLTLYFRLGVGSVTHVHCCCGSCCGRRPPPTSTVESRVGFGSPPVFVAAWGCRRFSFVFIGMTSALWPKTKELLL